MGSFDCQCLAGQSAGEAELTGHITKPGVDWALIEREYRDGKSCREIARKNPGISHVAIAKRARKHGWKVGLSPETARQLTALALETPGTLPGSYKGSEEKRARILEKLAMGSTLTIAAKAAGIDRNTLTDWRKNPDFLAACEKAEAAYAERQLGHIENAAERGDWRASSWVLERHPATRDEFGQQIRPQGPTIKIELALPYPKGRDLPIIDVESETVDPE